LTVRSATYRTICVACGVPIKKGSKVAKNFESGNWIHLRCQIRIVKSLNPEMTEAEAIASVGSAPTREGELVNRIRAMALQHGWLLYHPPPNIPTRDGRVREVGAGFPDLTLIHPVSGRLIFAELKSDSGRLTEPQERWLAALRLTEAIVEVWRPADLQRIREILEVHAEAPTY
jgi:hypothetical protein